MRSIHHSMNGQHLRRMACAGAGRRDTAVVAVAAAVVVGQLFTTKTINPRWASGGLPREGNP